MALSAIFVFCYRQYIFDSISQRDADFDQEDPTLLGATLDALDSSRKQKYIAESFTPQFVVLSFDGSKSVDMLNETLEFERKMIAKGKALHFTYFINGAYFLAPENSYLYTGPGQKSGVSKIGFSDKASDIADRVSAFNMAFREGNEIASHLVGHFNGIRWTYDSWKQEFTSFNDILSNVQKYNSSVPIPPLEFSPSAITGFRAPDLSVNENLYKILQNFHFTYDASGIGLIEDWPHKDNYGIWHIPLGSIYIGLKRVPTISMDYSIWSYQSQNINIAKKGSALWTAFHDEVLSAYMDYFNSNYNGSRAPIIIANHFSKWNDGVYWEAMKTFAERVCGEANVRCVTFKELVNYLNTYGVPKLKIL